MVDVSAGMSLLSAEDEAVDLTIEHLAIGEGDQRLVPGNPLVQVQLKFIYLFCKCPDQSDLRKFDLLYYMHMYPFTILHL